MYLTRYFIHFSKIHLPRDAHFDLVLKNAPRTRKEERERVIQRKETRKKIGVNVIFVQFRYKLSFIFIETTERRQAIHKYTHAHTPYTEKRTFPFLSRLGFHLF